MSLVKFLTQPIINWLNHPRPPSEVPLSDYNRIRTELKQCDVLLVEGRSRISDIIKLVTQSSWSHAALYLGRLHDIEDPVLRKVIQHHYQGDLSDQLIIESLLGYGTIVRNLAVYKVDHLRICRPTGLEYRDSQEVIRYATSRLGVDYDVRQIIDLARFLFPYHIIPRRWRSSLFGRQPGRSTKTVCSTMIAEAFGFVQFPILPLVKISNETGVQLFRTNPRLCTPNYFDYSPYFRIIKYPFINFDVHQNYRLLPWKGSAELTGDETKMYLDPQDGISRDEVDEAINNSVPKIESDEIEARTANDDSEDQPRLMN